MVLNWPIFSLMFLIHVFLYAGVYCSGKRGLINEITRRKIVIDVLGFLIFLLAGLKEGGGGVISFVSD